MLKSFKKKKDGDIQIFIIALLCLFMILTFLFAMGYREVLTSALMKVKTKADFTNLATYKYINQQQLAATGQVVFNDTDLNNCFDTFKSYLMDNLSLDSNLQPLDTNSFITDPLVINRLIIYSFNNGLLTEYEYTNSTHQFITVLKDYNGTATAPNGRKVEHTGVYSEVGFKMHLVKGYTYSNYIVSFTDVVN